MQKLNELKLGEECIVECVKARDNIKKRFLDIGLVRGTKIRIILTSPDGNMVAYLIKGTVIAIRKDDTKDITVRKMS